MKPTLWRVDAYWAPGFPRPTIRYERYRSLRHHLFAVAATEEGQCLPPSESRRCAAVSGLGFCGIALGFAFFADQFGSDSRRSPGLFDARRREGDR
jgi:hypothetical protein